MGTGLGINTSDVLIIILVDLNHQDRGKYFSRGEDIIPGPGVCRQSLVGNIGKKLRRFNYIHKSA